MYARTQACHPPRPAPSIPHPLEPQAAWARQIVEYGFPERQAIFALRETHFRGVEVAIEFLCENADKCNDAAGMTCLQQAGKHILILVCLL